VSFARTAELIEVPFWMWTHWARESVYQMGCTLAQPGEYDGTVHVQQ